MLIISKIKRNKSARVDRVAYCRTKDLKKCPQKKGFCLFTFKMAPKKPNSAKRAVAKMQLSTGKKTNVYIPGIGHSLQKFGTVLIRGGRANDLPGVKYRMIRGKFDLPCVYGRMQGRSKYGAKKYN